ncbi:phosphonoacetaldehyde hydrolase-like protein [Acropora muricata]|uniref:phosphonoacetaldehyde hydrolase-like protein n=1 Tax=Acropora millepora TaxID=45264 RepID=UPI0010FC96CB|nr:phosphonoacetaldehyde hydrolase-like protein [Acropora millepora]
MLFSIRNVCSTAARSLRPSVCSLTVLAKKTQSHANASTANVEDDLNLISGSTLQNPRSEYRMVRHYKGKVKGVILDWAGTVVDCGVYSPAVAFMEVFKQEGVPVTTEEAREPMGSHKRVHIYKMTQMESVRRRWFEKFGRYPDKEDVERMYNNFVPFQLGCILDYSQMITGAVETVNMLRNQMGLKIGSTTGFTTPMLDMLKKAAADQGYVPDVYVAADEVPQARPYPYMVWMNAIKLDVNPIEAIVKVDDTADGVWEGTSAGCWSVGLAKTGNYVGLNEEEISGLSKEDYERKISRSYDILANSGAHYVIDSITDLPPVIEDINRRLARGEKP